MQKSLQLLFKITVLEATIEKEKRIKLLADKILLDLTEEKLNHLMNLAIRSNNKIFKVKTLTINLYCNYLF